jgi:hypothetical protein
VWHMHASIWFHSDIKRNIRLCEFHTIVNVSKSLMKNCEENYEYVSLLFTFSISLSISFSPFFISRVIPLIFFNNKNQSYCINLEHLIHDNDFSNVWNILKPYKLLCQECCQLWDDVYIHVCRLYPVLNSDNCSLL